MKKNSKISVAIHTLIHLLLRDEAVTSEDLAKCIETNPVVIRRILGSLKKSKIVDSQKGHRGGWVMIKSSKNISFYDIYESLGESLLPKNHELEKDEQCLVLKTMSQTMDSFLIEAEALLGNRLKKIYLSDIINKI